MAVTAPLTSRASQPRHITARDKWLAAPRQREDWNREWLLNDILAARTLEGTSRKNIVYMLGEPGYTAVLYPGGDQIDEYRLSAENQRVYRIDYNNQRYVFSEGIEKGGCWCPQCKDTDPTVSVDKLRQTGLLRTNFSGDSFSIQELNAMLGVPGVTANEWMRVGGQMWLDYTYTWRVEGLPNTYFTAHGHAPTRHGTDPEPHGLAIVSWSLVTFEAGCLAK